MSPPVHAHWTGFTVHCIYSMLYLTCGSKQNPVQRVTKSTSSKSQINNIPIATSRGFPAELGKYHSNVLYQKEMAAPMTLKPLKVIDLLYTLFMVSG